MIEALSFVAFPRMPKAINNLLKILKSLETIIITLDKESGAG